MAVDTLQQFIAVIRDYGLLSPQQWDDLEAIA